jgi:ABC-type transport system involved in multi-copper enzyme maturation permease subunit
MTIHTRGYRRYEGSLDAKEPRFAPITAQGYEDTIRGPGFKVLFGFIIAITVLLALFVYLELPFLTESFLSRHDRMERRMGNLPSVLADPVKNLENAVLLFDQWTTLFVMLMALFAGSGLISEDLKSRALPLYLVRPITPFDYYLGKFLIPVRLFARAVLLPLVLLVVLAALLRPSEEMWTFLWGRMPLLGSIVAYYLAIAVGYTSVTLLFSALTKRKITSIVLAGVAFIGGTMVRGVVYRADGTVADVLRSFSISGDAGSILWAGIGREVPRGAFPRYAPPEFAIAAILAVAIVTAIVVLKRARSVEVVA